MATVVSVPSATATGTSHTRPSFVGIARGELFKVSRQLSTWVFAVLYIGTIILPLIVELSPGFKESMQENPTWAIYKLLGTDMLVLKVFGGALLIAVTARLIGMEYSGGTIRVLLARGVGRLQLLFGKLVALVLIALLLVVGTVLLDLALAAFLSLAAQGNLDLFKAATATFWSDSGTHLLLALVSLGVTILMATAVTAVSRSLAVGMSLGLLWYPAEAISVILLALASQVTNSDFWLLLSGDFLGLNLDAMAGAILPARAQPSVNLRLPTPLVPVDGGHTLLVTGIFALAFAAVTIVLTARQDVKE